MGHFFHQTIAGLLNIHVAPAQFQWDKACGGSQWVSLFRDAGKSRASRYACADGVLILDSTVRLIIEIEEVGPAGFLPARLTGKLTTSALSRYFIASGSAPAVPFANRVTFAQIVNTEALKERSRKPEQYVNLEQDIRATLLPFGSVSEYQLITGNSADFTSGAAGQRLLRLVRSVLPS